MLVLWAIFTGCWFAEVIEGFDSHLRGPTFIMEPPARLEFSNSSGGWLDCSASGSPQPSIEWTSMDGTPIGDIAGIRRVLQNGTLVFHPFGSGAYRQDIHNSVYRCIAFNTMGRIISRDVQIRAVVTQAFKVDVEVIGAARGCTAVMKCVIPPFVKDLVRIISWIQEPSFFIYPSLQGDGKFHQLPTGELLIQNLEFSDQFSTYRCRTMHRLSRQVVVSSPANVRITEHRGIASPIIIEHSGLLTVAQDEGAAMICIAQGCPAPEYSWHSLSGAESNIILSGARTRQLSTVLAIEAVTPDDEGVYRCTASNAGGDASADIRLAVITPLRVEIIPTSLSVHIGGSAEFRCIVSASGGPHLITWYKDGRQLPSTGRGPSESLVINNVGREDRGMYQCIVRRTEGDTAQAAGELQLGDAPPILLYSFIEQTLQPGPAVSLKCSASGNPTPQISWGLDGFSLPSHGRFVIGQYVTIHGDVISHVNISHVMVEDGGEYTCTAENRAGKVSHSARLNVYGMPYIRLIPKVTAVAGETLQLKCPVAGYPIEEIHWERNGRELPSDLRQKVIEDGTLIVNPIEKKADSGVYTCWARNKQGHSARRSGEVTVIVPPKVSPFYAEDTLHVGDRVSLTCSVTKGDLPLTISWHKDGRNVNPALMASITQVDQFTSILVIESLSAEHSGNYSCVVRNLAAEVSHTHQLTVNVPPIIEPFSFQDGLSEGMRTRTVCGVSAGDPPLVVSWLKDGHPLAPSLNVNVSALDPYSSLLSISSLDSRHTGDFTCVASNPASEVRYTAKLQVKVPPRWSVEPVDLSVERNHHVSLNCQAQGVPTPIVTWKKATGSKSGTYDEIQNHMYTKIFNNGTLLIQHVKEDREGYYLCQAENGVGTGIGKVIQLRVNSSPYFATPSRSLTVKKGDTATLQCDVNGDKPIMVVWTRSNKLELHPSSNYRIHLKQDVTPEGVTAELQILNTEAADSGAYFCQASNMYGKEQQHVQLLVQEPPVSPHSLEVAMVSSRSVNIKWQQKTTESNDVVRFIIEYRELGKPWRQIEIAEIPLPSAALIEDLKPATKYAFHILAEGPAGKSAPSSELVVRTEPQRPSGPPQNLAVRPISSTEFIITWIPPAFDLRHGDIQGYNIGHRTLSTSIFNFTSVLGDGEDGGELLLGGLLKFTRYTIVAQAFNEVGTGPLSEPVIAQTTEDVPNSAPLDIRCASLTSQSVQVSWQPPRTEDCNGLLQGYKLTYEPIPDENWKGIDEMETRKTTALTTVITGLRKYTNYSLQVLGFTKIGDGVMSIPIHCQTEEDVPGAPRDIKVITSSHQSFIVAWLPPLYPNGKITKYNLYKRSMDGPEEVDHGKQTIPSQYTSYEIKNVHQHVEYQFWITASTRIGEGQSSKVISQIATHRVAAKIISFGGIFVQPWHSTVTFPCQAVGSPRREWFRGNEVLKGGANHNQQLLDTGELIISNLQPSDTGNYTCQVDNEQGSDRITYMLSIQVPPKAPLLYVTSATSSSILLHWKSGDIGGAILTGYKLNYRKEDGNVNEITLSRHAASYELKGLSCGTIYHLHLTAHNKIGSSPSSQPLQARTQGHPPGVPPAAAFIFPNSTSVTLKLHVWPDNGCPILHFVLQYRKISESQWTLVSNAIKPQRRTSITGLTPATQYIVKLEAYNIAGFSSEEFSFITLTKDGDVPSPDLMKQGHSYSIFYSDMKLLIPVIAVVIAIAVASFVTVVCFKYYQRRNVFSKNQLESQECSSAQRERFYATIHKAAFQNEKIPETSEDISPYATFQLSEPSTMVAQNTLLHSFMYHEHPMTDGCASPPPPTSSSHRNSPYYNLVAGKWQGLWSDKRRDQYQQKHQNLKAQNRRPPHRKADVDSEDSESDPEQITSSRTESCNRLDAKHKQNLYYHGAHSSTSSDISPMSEQKSLPRRNRSRWLGHNRGYSQRQSLQHMTVAETTFNDDPETNGEHISNHDRTELSEAECDIDTIKKLKLGLRSTLWSRPNHGTQATDYSIAV